jgi:hypothetical protein
MRCRLTGIAVAVAAITSSHVAWAQVRWDVGAEAGGMKRFLASSTATIGVGPAFEVHGHVALLPLVRVGGYFGHDGSPVGPGAARQITTFGARVKVTPPWPRDEWHTWVFAGFGYALAYGPSYSLTLSPDQGPTQAFTVDGASGHFFEIPIGVGVGWRFKRPWELTAELSGRIGLGPNGQLYDLRNATAPGVPSEFVDPFGNDSFAIGLMLGIGLDL